MMNKCNVEDAVDGVSDVVDELVIVNTNKQVSDYKDTGVDGYIGDEILNEIDRIAKKYCWSV